MSCDSNTTLRVERDNKRPAGGRGRVGGAGDGRAAQGDREFRAVRGGLGDGLCVGDGAGGGAAERIDPDGTGAGADGESGDSQGCDLPVCDGAARVSGSPLCSEIVGGSGCGELVATEAETKGWFTT